MAKRKAKAPVRPAGVEDLAIYDPGRKVWVAGPNGEYWFDETAAQRAVEFFPKYLRLTKGEWARRPFELKDWQANDIIRPAFGWKRSDGTRRYRKVYVWVPRKNGKTELAAGVALLLLVGDGEPGAEVYSIARDEDQARIVFDKSSVMVNWSDGLSRDLEVYKTSVYCPATLGSFKPLTGRAAGKHGLNMSGLVGDEVHEWRDGELYTFVHQSSGSRRQPLEFLISTAGNKSGYGYEEWEYCQRVKAGIVEDHETLVVIYAADPEADDWQDQKTWAKANPNLGVSVKLDYLEAEARKARDLPRLENDFKRYHLNWWTEQAVRWLSMDKWDACAGDIAWQDLDEHLKGRMCYAAGDLSSTTDLTCELLLFPPIAEDPYWYVLPRFFVPADNIDIRVRRDRVPYDKWRDEGAIITTPGDVIDFDYFKLQVLGDPARGIAGDAESYEIEQFGLDPFNAPQLAIQLQAEGLNVGMVRQGFLTLNAPSKELERLVLSQGIRHGGHPVLRWCATNVAIETDAAGSIKPTKAKSHERIDGIAALVTALAVHIAQAGQPHHTSPYDEDPEFSVRGDHEAA